MHFLSAITKVSVKALSGLTFLVFLVIQPSDWLTIFTSPQALAQSKATQNYETSILLNLQGSSNPTINLLRGIQEEQSIQGIFKGANWIFYPDGKFIFTPSQINSSRVKLSPISGTYKQFEDRLEFQAMQQSSNLQVSLDGVIRKDGKGWLLDAIYTNSSWQDPRQIARVIQSLTSEIIKQPVIESTTASQPQPNSYILPSEIKIPELESIRSSSISTFDIIFEGKTESGAFSRIPGFLFITFIKDSKSPLSISLGVDPTLIGTTNGGFILNTNEVKDPSVQIQSNSSQLQIEFKPSKKMRAINWWTLSVGKSTSSEPIPVMGESATVNLSIQGEQVTGEIYARGISSDDKPSTYDARITGRIQKSLLTETEQLRNSLNISGFSGRWNTSSEDTKTAFGQIELQQIGQQVVGSFSKQGNRIIEGSIATQNRIDFTWHNNQKGQEKSFFRLIGGTLIGLLSNKNSQENTPLVATWELPKSLSTQSLTPVDIRDLRNLAHELASEGRCEQAISLLDQVFNFYRNEQQKSTTPLFDQERNSISTAFSLSLVSIPCNFRLGDYNNLVDSLNHYVDIQLFLKPEAMAGRLFRQRTASLAKSLNSNLRILAIFQNNFSETKKLTNSNRFVGRIGIGLEKDEKNQALVIWKVLKGEPAEKAGILSQDVLIKINELSTKGMNAEQASEKLRGNPDTPVTIRVIRDNREIDFKLVRKQVEVYPATRQTEISQAIVFLVDYLINVQARLQIQQIQLANIETKIIQAQVDPIQAWITLTENISSQKAQIDAETDSIITRFKILFKGQTALLQDADAILQATPRICDTGKISELNISNKLGEWDNRINLTLENSNDLTLVEKTLLRGTLNLAVSLNSLSIALDCEHKFLAQIDAKKQFEDRKRQATETSNSLDRAIERWRKKLVDDAPKIEALDKGQPFFQKLISLLVELGDEKGALVTSEKSRARAFADLLATRLSTNSVQTSAESPTLAQIQQIAKTQSATLVQYSIVENAGKESDLFIWVVQPTGEVNFKKVSLKSIEQNKSSLENLIIETRIAIFDQRANSESGSPNSNLQQLYQLLIQPISKFLPSDPNAHIIFIPQKDLFLVPFPALLDADGMYLIQKHTILTSPSIQALDSTHQLRKQNVGVAKENLVVGNPIYARKQQPLDDLKNWEQGAKDIAAQLNTRAIIGRDATKTTIKGLLPQARIIHLATHSGFNGENPLESWIALTPEGSNDNGDLTVRNLLDWYAPPKGIPLHAELIVLAACETGQGQITGDGVNGLARSLITAGIPSVVVSLWQVNEIPTIFLMKEFYKNLQSGKAKSLRQAMLTTMKEYPNQVATWAGFTLIGEAE